MDRTPKFRLQFTSNPRDQFMPSGRNDKAPRPRERLDTRWAHIPRPSPNGQGIQIGIAGSRAAHVFADADDTSRFSPSSLHLSKLSGEGSGTDSRARAPLSVYKRSPVVMEKKSGVALPSIDPDLLVRKKLCLSGS